MCRACDSFRALKKKEWTDAEIQTAMNNMLTIKDANLEHISNILAEMCNLTLSERDRDLDAAWERKYRG